MDISKMMLIPRWFAVAVCCKNLQLSVRMHLTKSIFVVSHIITKKNYMFTAYANNGQKRLEYHLMACRFFHRTFSTYQERMTLLCVITYIKNSVTDCSGP